MIKAVIFDMNGVIIGDSHIHRSAWSEVVKKYNVSLEQKTFSRLCSGKTDQACALAISQEFKKDFDIDAIVRQKEKLYLELLPKDISPIPGVSELIKDLGSKYLLGVASSASRQNVDMVLNNFQIKNFFKVTVSGDDVMNSKPDPEPYLLCAKKLDVDPAECVVIEDSASGVRAAKSAGMICIGILTTHSKSSLEEAGADKVIESFDPAQAGFDSVLDLISE